MGSKKEELMANTTNMIEARNMSFDYFKRDENGEITGKERALDGIDLEVKHGQFIAILGSNG
jgi:ABC-type multidrug transport system ATPase subunit